MTAAVEPNRHAGAPEALRAEAEAAAGALPSLLVEAERVASTVAQGVHGRRRVGVGESFWQFRRYGHGDAIGRIDWRQTAKRDRAFVRETEWEASQTVLLWADHTPSMDWRARPDRPTKLHRAHVLLLALASLLNRGGERVGLLGGADAPAAGRADMLKLAQSLLGGQGPASIDGFDRLPPVRRHACLVLVGDFLDPLDRVAAAIGRFGSRSAAGHLIQILDPAEESLPYDGRIRFAGVEGEPDLLVPRVDIVRSAYAERMRQHRDGLQALARAAGWSFAVHHTDRPASAALLSLHAALGAEPAFGAGGSRT